MIGCHKTILIFSIVMPEGIKNILHDDASVLEVSDYIEEIISSGGLALEEIKHETRLHTRCCMLGMESSHLATMQVILVSDWSKQYNNCF